MLNQLLMPNIVDAANKGVDRGNALAFNQLAGQYVSDPTNNASLLGQLAARNPGQAMGLQNAVESQQALQQRTQLAQQQAQLQKIGGAAKFMYQAVQSGDPAKIQGAYQAVYPALSSVAQEHGQPAPPTQWDDSMLPHLYQVLGMTGGLPQDKLLNVPEGGSVIDSVTHQPVFQSQPKDPAQVAFLKALQQNPGLMDTAVQLKKAGRAQVQGGGFGHAPMGYRFKSDGSLEAIPGGPSDPNSNPIDLSPDAVTNSAWDLIMGGKMPSLGRSKEALAVRGQIMNEVAKIAKAAGVSPQDLATQPGRVKALQASLQNLQKQSDVMEKSEETFQNNANVLLNLSDQVSRSGIPAFNQFLLHVKTNYRGDPQAASFLAARNLVAQEYAKIASSATGAAGSSDTAQAHALSLINTAQTPEQLRAVIHTLGQDIDGQKAATERQLLQISSRMQQFGATSQYPGHEFQAPVAQPAQAATAQPPAPRAINPQTGHAIVWNGSAWVPEQ